MPRPHKYYRAWKCTRYEEILILIASGVVTDPQEAAKKILEQFRD